MVPIITIVYNSIIMWSLAHVVNLIYIILYYKQLDIKLDHEVCVHSNIILKLKCLKSGKCLLTDKYVNLFKFR